MPFSDTHTSYSRPTRNTDKKKPTTATTDKENSATKQHAFPSVWKSCEAARLGNEQRPKGHCLGPDTGCTRGRGKWDIVHARVCNLQAHEGPAGTRLQLNGWMNAPTRALTCTRARCTSSLGPATPKYNRWLYTAQVVWLFGLRGTAIEGDCAYCMRKRLIAVPMCPHVWYTYGIYRYTRHLRG